MLLYYLYIETHPCTKKNNIHDEIFIIQLSYINNNTAVSLLQFSNEFSVKGLDSYLNLLIFQSMITAIILLNEVTSN